jgi:BirA family transcriptional regulator, biotin operon repressor / biotin---[acetyl-CoA-carboxylase] ligase
MHRPPLDVERLQAVSIPRWARVRVVAETGSTNADLLADAGAPDRSVLVAEHQQAGRGRLTRSWTSQPGAGLTFSVLLRPPVPLARWGWLPLLTGVAVREAVESASGIDAGLKWPNDVLGPRAEGKLAGILAQTADDGVVIGVGLNVSTAKGELPVDTASSLALEGAPDVDRTDLLGAILSALDTRVAQWVDCRGDAAACGLAAAYAEHCRTIGRPVRVTLAGGAALEGEALEGEATGVDELGRLLVRTADGPRVVGAGDVEHVRGTSAI